MKRILIVDAVLALCFLYAVPSMAKPWVLEETNRDANRVMSVFVQWTKKDVTFATEPLADLNPGESKTFKPPKDTTDWVQTSFFRTGDPDKTTVKGLVLKEGNSFEVGDIADVLDPFPVGTEFLIPDPFVSGVELFAGVDLAMYIPLALSSIPSSLAITNGVSPFLPGYLIGTTEVAFDSNLGLATNNPFTGTVVFDANHSITVVPEPPILALFAVGLIGLGGFGWQQHWSARRLAE